MALKITGLEQTIKKLRNAAARHEIKVTEAYRNFVWTVFEDVVRHTPQWSGNLASNWRVEISGVSDRGYTPFARYEPKDWRKVRPLRAGGLGMDEALDLGHRAIYGTTSQSYGFGLLTRNVGNVRWNSRIRILNHTPYGEDVETGSGPDGRDIRPVNKFSGANVPAHGVAMVQYAITKYSKFSYRNAAYGGILKSNNKAFS